MGAERIIQVPLGNMTRPLLSRVTAAVVVALLWAIGTGPAGAQEQSGSMSLADVQPIELPVPLDRIYPGGERLVLGVSREARLAVLLNADGGRVLAEQPFEGVPVFAVTFASPDAPASLAAAFIVELESGGYAFQRFAVHPDRGFERLGAPEDVIPKSFREPAANFVPFGKGGYPEDAAIVIWDQALEPGTEEYLFLWDFKAQFILARDYPQRLIPIGSDEWMLALHPLSDRASVVELLSGRRDDNVLVERLGVEATEQLAVFTPGALYGGSGDSVIANGSSRLLIAMSVQEGYPPLIDPPLQIALDAIPSDRSGRFAPWIAADRGMSLILVGSVGNDQAHVFRRIRGGIGAFGTLSLGMPVRDVTVLHGPAETDPEAFVFLGADGRELMVIGLGDFQPQVEAVVIYEAMVIDEAGSTAGVEITALNPGDIARIQRVLASFGFPVGAIDGVIGPRTVAAVRAFQYENGLEPSGQFDEETLSELSMALRDMSQRSSFDQVIGEYRDFLAKSAGIRVDAGRLLTLGVSQEDPDHPCFGLNAPPPQALWPNSVKFAQLLRRLETEYELDVQVVSGYRTPAYNRCIGDEPTSSHQRFAAFDIRLADTSTFLESSSRLLLALEELQAKGYASLETTILGSSVHVEPVLGQWHTIIASYSTDPRGCQAARNDVDEFSRLLAGSELAGREILVVRTSVSGHYAVTVDTNGDEAAARRAAQLIREMSQKSTDLRTGRDSYVQQNDEWRFDPDCAHVRVLN